MLKNKKNLGFTLIELLVVISIIGFLATASVVAFNSARIKARDARRLSDITLIIKAIDLYYDTNNKYPQMIAYTSSAANSCGVNWCVLETALAPYMAKLPRDPLGNQNNYRYYYDSNSGDNYQTYGIMIRLESPGNYSLATTDGGYYNSGGQYLEKGDQPSYCRLKYSGSSGNWWSSGANVCVGGN